MFIHFLEHSPTNMHLLKPILLFKEKNTDQYIPCNQHALLSKLGNISHLQWLAKNTHHLSNLPDNIATFNSKSHVKSLCTPTRLCQPILLLDYPIREIQPTCLFQPILLFDFSLFSYQYFYSNQHVYSRL